jgi:hypothetical protein
MQGLSILRQAESLASAGTLDDPHHLVVHGLVRGHDWGIQEVPQGFDHLLFAIDKFTKWIEVQPIINPKLKRVAEFI